MPETHHLKELIQSAQTLRTRIVWLIGAPGTGKSQLLKRISVEQSDNIYVNLNAALARSLSEESELQRVFRAGSILAEVLPPKATGAWLLDNIELLCSHKLKFPVVDRLKSIAQGATLVIAWPGTIEGGRLTYGARNHPPARQMKNSARQMKNSARQSKTGELAVRQFD